MKGVSWHKAGKGKISAPLKIDPIAGALTGALKMACNKHCEATGVQVTVCLRASFLVGSDAKSESLRQKACGLGCKFESENVDDSVITIARKSLRLPQGLIRLLANW